MLVFPASGEPTAIVQMPTFLDGWRSAQEWVSDIRPRGKTWADSVAARLKELKLDAGKIGMDGYAGPLAADGWLPHNVHTRLVEVMPSAAFVAMDDMLEKVRSIKSSEELATLRQAAKLGDLMLATCRETARPGMKDCEVYANMMRAIVANGGEEPRYFSGPTTNTPTRIRSAYRPRGRWRRATSSSARCIRSSAATSPMSSARFASASRSPSKSRSRRAVSRPTGADSRASGPARPSRPRWRP